MSSIELTDHQWLLVLNGCPHCTGALEPEKAMSQDAVTCAECGRAWDWEELEDIRG